MVRSYTVIQYKMRGLFPTLAMKSMESLVQITLLVLLCYLTFREKFLSFEVAVCGIIYPVQDCHDRYGIKMMNAVMFSKGYLSGCFIRVLRC